MKLLTCKRGKKKMRMISRRCGAFMLALIMVLSGTFFYSGKCKRFHRRADMGGRLHGGNGGEGDGVLF